jgi:pimeloyl-ACP methyl ester carboxylesterase
MWERHIAVTGAGLVIGTGEFDPALPSLLCVHGSGGCGQEFLPMLGHLKGKANGAAIDLPGHCRTRGPGRVSVWDYAQWVADFIAAGPIRPVLLGNSLGGAIALALGLGRPELLSGLVLWGTGGRLKVLPAILEGLKNDFLPTVEMLVRHAFAEGTDSAIKEAGRKSMAATLPEVLLGDYSACNDFDVMERLGEITLPTLVVCGQEDRLTPVKYGQFLTKGIAGSRMVVVPGAGHVLHQEKPRESAQALEGFLAALT